MFPNQVGKTSKITKLGPQTQVDKKSEEPKPGPSKEVAQKCDAITNLFAERRQKMQEQKKENEVKVFEEKKEAKKEDTSNLSLKKVFTKNVHEYFSVVAEKGKMAEKLRKAAPYNFFLTTVTESPVTHNEPLSVTFMELLDPSLGDLESSVQINFMVDLGWLLAQYYFTGNE